MQKLNMEHTLRCAPYGIVIGEGADPIFDTPQMNGPEQQYNWFQMKNPVSYFARGVVSDYLVEDYQRKAVQNYPNQLLASCVWQDQIVLATVTGPKRDIISTSVFPLHEWNRDDSQTIDIADVNHFIKKSALTWPTHHRPHLMRAAQSVQQLEFNKGATGGWKRALKYNNEPILAVRSHYGIEFYRMLFDSHDSQDREQRAEDSREKNMNQKSSDHVSSEDTFEHAPKHVSEDLISENISFEKIGQLMNNFGCTLLSDTKSSLDTHDFAWNPFLTESGVLLLHDGSLIDISLGRGKSNLRGTIAYKPSLEDRPVYSDFSSQATNLAYRGGRHRCCFTARHPRQVALAIGSNLNVIDLRGGNRAHSDVALRLFECPPGEWFTAVTASPIKPSNTNNSTSTLPQMTTEHYIAAVSSSRVLLFDLRRPQSHVAEWKHDLRPQNIRREVSLSELYHEMPDEIFWLPSWQEYLRYDPQKSSFPEARFAFQDSSTVVPSTMPSQPCDYISGIGRVLVLNSWRGRGIVCEWNQREPVSAYLVAKAGDIFESKTPLNIEENSDPMEEKQALQNSKDMSSEPIDIDIEKLRFFRTPTYWTDIVPVESFSLLFDKDIFPPSYSSARHRALLLQRIRLERNLRESVCPVSNIERKQNFPDLVGTSLVLKDWKTNRNFSNPIMITTGSYQETIFSMLFDLNASESLSKLSGVCAKDLIASFPRSMEPNTGSQDFLSDQRKLIQEARIDLPLDEIVDADQSKHFDMTTKKTEEKQSVEEKQSNQMQIPFHCWLLREALQQYHNCRNQSNSKYSNSMEQITKIPVITFDNLHNIIDDSDVAVTSWEMFYLCSPYLNTIKGSPSTPAAGENQDSIAEDLSMGIMETDDTLHGMKGVLTGFKQKKGRRSVRKFENTLPSTTVFLNCLQRAGMIPVPHPVRKELEKLKRMKYAETDASLSKEKRRSYIESSQSDEERVTNQSDMSEDMELDESISLTGTSTAHSNDIENGDLIFAADSCGWQCPIHFMPHQNAIDNMLKERMYISSKTERNIVWKYASPELFYEEIPWTSSREDAPDISPLTKNAISQNHSSERRIEHSLPTTHRVEGIDALPGQSVMYPMVISDEDMQRYNANMNKESSHCPDDISIPAIDVQTTDRQTHFRLLCTAPDVKVPAEVRDIIDRLKKEW